MGRAEEAKQGGRGRRRRKRRRALQGGRGEEIGIVTVRCTNESTPAFTDAS
jgi:hypothetical protein